MKCTICGKEFEPGRPWQKYCTPACKRIAYRRRKQEQKKTVQETEETIIREFHCRKCGTLVQVKTHKDFRMRFCSQKCEKAYWKHPHKNVPEEPAFHFRCEECGKPVTVSDPKDKRKRFCSTICRCRWNNKKQLSSVKEG